jgi:hypothetical protein
VTNKQLTTEIMSARIAAVSVVLLAVIAFASQCANAQDIDVPVEMHCGPYNGEVYAPAFDASYDFRYLSGRLRADRATKITPW